MLFGLLLTLHLVGAFILFVLLGRAVYSLISNNISALKPSATSIAWGLAFQLITGSFMALAASNGMSLIAFCNRVVLYVGLTLIVEMMLFFKMRRSQALFPLYNVASSFGVGLIFVIATAFTL
jgi:hypothetical protein